MISVTFPSAGGQSGSNYNVPEPGDVSSQSLTDYLVQLASQGLAIPSSADLDLGAAWGIKAAYFKSRTANPAASGVARMAASDQGPTWRNAANTGDVGLAKDAGDALLFNGANVTGNPMLGANTTAAQSIPNSAVTIVVFGTVELDSDSAYNSSTGRYTVPTGKGGHYEITASIAFNAALTGNIQCLLNKNGATAKAFNTNNTTASQSLPVSALLLLAAGDIIDVRAFQNSGGAAVLNNGATLNYFALKRIPT